MEIQIKGSLRYALTGLLFLGFSLFIVNVLFRGQWNSNDLFWGWYLVVATGVMACIQFYLLFDSWRYNDPAYSHRVPQRYAFLVTGYLFLLAGVTMTLVQLRHPFLPDIGSARFAYWFGTMIFLLPGIFMFFSYIYRRLPWNRDRQLAEIKELNLSGLIGVLVGVSTLAGMLVAGIWVLITGENETMTIIGTVFTSISALALIITLVVVLKIRPWESRKII